MGLSTPTKWTLVAVGVAVIAFSVVAGRRDAPAPAPAVAKIDAPGEQPHADLKLASLQEAFAISHLGALRDEAEAVDAPARPASADQKPRGAGPKPGAKPVATTPLPPVIPAPGQQPSQARPQSAPTSLFGFMPKLPSPGKIVDQVASLGDKITSLVRGR
jgi:hypothetical protein